MARLPRYLVKDVPLHIILRGNNRNPIFGTDEDCQFFKEVLLDAAKRHGLAIHAYVLMTNHIHVLASPSTEQSVPKALQSVGRRYVQFFNFHYQRTGTLWEGRYRATVVEAETYLFECMRYIELNPVRAGMVRHPREYVWSSYRANAEGKVDELVSPHALSRRLSRQEGERRAANRALVKLPMDATLLGEIRDCTNKGGLGRWPFPREDRAAARAQLTEPDSVHTGTPSANAKRRRRIRKRNERDESAPIQRIVASKQCCAPE